MEEDEILVRKLAKAAGTSPTIIQTFRSNSKQKKYIKLRFFMINESTKISLFHGKQIPRIFLENEW